MVVSATLAQPGDHLEIRVLGPITVRLDGRRIRIGDAKHRLLLAMLVAAEGRLVPTQLLVDQIWDDHTPQTARELIHSYVSDLRRCLEAGRPGTARILPRHHDGGYQIQIRRDHVDLWRFRDLRARIRPLTGHDDTQAAALLRQALALWAAGERGDPGDSPFTDLNGTPVADCRWLEAYRHALREEHRATLIACLEAEMRLGEHERLIAELANLAAADPRDERIVGLLLTAYYRSGRQDQVMRTYRRTRARLQTELGVEPGRHLSELYERILRQDPSLNVRAGSAVSPDAPPALSGFCSGLPSDSACFQGRDAELTEAVSYISRDTRNISLPVVCVVSGMAGVGKTAFAVRVARAVADYFPDGCLFLDLHGYTSSGTPLTSSDALGRMLRRLGLAGEQIPAQFDERVACFRTLLTGKRMLVVLDNAVSSDQVRPLLPATADSGVLITSRHRLLSLDDAHHLPLDVLALPDATAVFTSVARIGSLRRDREVHELVQACGRLPLALRIMAARCREGHPRLIGELAARLKDDRLRLDEIEDGERGVMATFNLSYQALPPQTQRLFVLLGLYPGADWSAHAAAALAGLELPHAVRQLERLLNASLVQQDSDGRYRFHDLVGSYAARQARSSLTVPERDVALHRMLTWAHDTLTAADTLITPHRYQPSPGTGQGHPSGPSLTCYSDAYAWVSAEHRTLAQICSQAVNWRMPSYSWQIAYELRGFYFVAKQWDDWIATHRTALDATLLAGDVAAEAMTRNNLGLALMETGALGAAEEQFLRAQGLFEQLHDQHGVSNATANQAAVLYYRGEYGSALLMNESAYDFYRESGNDRNAAITLRSIGLIEIELGRFGPAVHHLETARHTFVALRLPLDETMAMNCLGEAHQRSGNVTEAERWSRRALELSQSCGSSYEQARAYRNLGQTAFTQGDSQKAAALWRQALSLFTTLRAPEVKAVQDSLTSLGGCSR